MSKIIFELEPSDWHEHATESLWALPLGSNLFKIDNVPFYVYGISNQDTVKALLEDEMLAFSGLKEKGGHSTYRIFVSEDASDEVFDQYWKELDHEGCSKENGWKGFFAIDVPHDSDINKVYSLLERGEQEGVWVFEEGDCGH